jgi:hypothetical protein
MRWADYKPIPGVNWGDPANAPGRALRVALVAIDFEDQPFVMTRGKHSDPFGNPQVDPVARAEVARFYADFWGKPGPLNHGHTIHEYWMEQSRGRRHARSRLRGYRCPRLFKRRTSSTSRAAREDYLRRTHGARRGRALAG